MTVMKPGCAVLTTEAPGEPKDVAIDKFDRSSVTLKWKPPNDDGGNPIKGFYRMLSSCVLWLTRKRQSPVTPLFSVPCFILSVDNQCPYFSASSTS